MTPTSARDRPPDTTNDRVHILDGLRLCAALMVVGWHLVAGNADDAWQASAEELFGPLWAVSRYGWLGVELFFLISGFVICMSSWGRSVGQFAVSRIVRLYPAYWAAVILTTAVIAAFPLYQKPLSTVDTLANLTMVQGLVDIRNLDLSYWTLLVELTFYVLFAFVVARGLTYKRVVWFCLGWTGAVVVATGFDNNHLNMILGSGYAPYFVAGVAFYLIRRFSSSLLLWGIVAVSWVLALDRLRVVILTYDAGFRVSAGIVTFFFILMGAIALGWFDWVSWRWLVTAGVLTYPLYLLHQVIGLTIIKATHPYAPPWVLLGALVIALLAAAWLMHRLVERPAARLLRRQLLRSLDQMRTSTDPPGAAAPHRATIAQPDRPSDAEPELDDTRTPAHSGRASSLTRT